ncbi:MAG: DNA recombination protein RmuC [Candidatus Kaiserbacteria bacterium]|nr:DNA recombination protein RmuC [Candidatus Kaiserbacteria bacterium]
MDVSVILLVLLLLVMLGVLGAVVWLVLDRGKSAQYAGALETQLQDFRKTLDTRLHQGSELVNKQMQSQAKLLHDQMRSQFDSSKKLVEDITKELTEVKATGREMLSFTDQLQALERTLKNPQRRGAVGEYVLEQVIANVLSPDSYTMQYSFKNGSRADAVLTLRDKQMVSIDAKFSLDNYTKLLDGDLDAAATTEAERRLKEDIKMRIQETAKYILPKEGTLDFAFMFIPSESLYYDLLTQKIGAGDGAQNMLEYAFRQHNVVIVSPTTLLAYLQTVNLGLRSLKVEEHAQEIITRVEVLRKRLEGHAKAFHGVGKSLSAAVKHYNSAEQKYDLIDKDVFKITGKGGEYSRELLDGPHGDEE